MTPPDIPHPGTVSAWDITAKGGSTPATDDGPAPCQGAKWRWLHFDKGAAGFAEWVDAHLPAHAAAALKQSETRPRVEVQDDGVILSLRAINLNPGASDHDMVALRLWVTPTLVVSARRRRIFAADDIRDELAAGHGPEAPDRFLVRLTSALMNRIEEATEKLEDATDDMEAEFQAQDFNHGDDLAKLRARAIKLRRHIAPQRLALEKLAALPDPHTGRISRRDLSEVANRGARVVEEVETIAQRLQIMQDQLASENAERITRQGFVLSVVAAIFLPLGFLTGLFGVNLGGMPGTGAPWAFAALTMASLVVGLGLFWLFRRLKWF